ncbi:MAG: hypothetical protein JNM18_14065, partial [Planctomycetaceae bacterium]|nr:hypothetical protein [Planctomycetaceae bacterium]
MSPLIATLLSTLGCLLVGMTALWLVSLVLRDASSVDPVWGTGFGIVAGLAFWLITPSAPRDG